MKHLIIKCLDVSEIETLGVGVNNLRLTPNPVSFEIVSEIDSLTLLTLTLMQLIQ
jgi:hypothetical protein